MEPLFSNLRTCRYATNAQMAGHAHQKPSLALVLSGGYHENIEGQTSWNGPGSVLVCPAEIPHAQEFGALGAHKLILEPSMLGLGEICARLGQKETLRALRMEAIDLRVLGQKMADELDHPDPVSDLALQGLSYQFVAALVRGREYPQAALPRSLGRALEVLNHQLGQRLDLLTLAQLADTTPDRLDRQFRLHLGVSAAQYYRKLKIQKAARDLAKTKKPICDIALECGFSDQAHLNRTFRLVMGMTPGAYRQNPA